MDYKQMCVQQGYVPSTCTMEGQMCWALVQSQGDPCKGCNANRSVCNGRHAPYENEQYGFMCFLDKMDEVDRKRREENRRKYEEEISKRKESHLKGNTVLEVRWDRSRKSSIEIVVKDCTNEKAYYTQCEYITNAVPIIQSACHKYRVEQIQVEDNGIGMGIYDAIIKVIDYIDVVPLRYTKMKLFE